MKVSDAYGDYDLGPSKPHYAGGEVTGGAPHVRRIVYDVRYQYYKEYEGETKKTVPSKTVAILEPVE